MDEIGRGNEGYDDDNNGDYDDFNPPTEETELINDDDDVDINKSFTNEEVDELTEVNYKPVSSLTKSTNELLDLELKEFLKHMGYDDNDTTDIEKERFKVARR